MGVFTRPHEATGKAYTLLQQPVMLSTWQAMKQLPLSVGLRDILSYDEDTRHGVMDLTLQYLLWTLLFFYSRVVLES